MIVVGSHDSIKPIVIGDGYPFDSPGRHILWLPFEFSPGDCGVASQADTHFIGIIVFFVLMVSCASSFSPRHRTMVLHLGWR